jgi:hypothetical protein
MDTSSIPAWLLREYDRITVDGRLVEITASHPLRRFADERREHARSYELAWQDVETWQLGGAVYAALDEFPFIRPAVQTLEAAS